MKNPTRFHLKTLVVALAGVGLASLPQPARANPTGGQVVAGSATIQQESATKLGITQTSERAILDWQQYSIGANEHVQYYQPSASAVALNRVTGQDPSQILGRLSANGQVYLVNPNGIYFGKTAQIDVAGLVATTHDIRNADFMAGKREFTIPGKPGASVINEGSIRIADTGIAAFVAPSVANRGVIAAKLGKVTLAAANGFTLDFTGDDLLSFMVGDEVAKTAFDLDGNPLTSFVDNAGRIEADGGRILMTAKAAENAIHGVINHSGVSQAITVEQRAGEIILHAGKGSLKVGGTLDASAPSGGDGGFIETSGGVVDVAERTNITTSAPFGDTGTWLIDPNDYTIASSGGNITGAALSNILGTTNFVVRTDTMGTSGGHGDIYVNDAISWNAPTMLQFWAERNVTINGSINGNNPDSIFYSIGKLNVTGSGSVNVGTVRYDVMDAINLVGTTTAGQIWINSGAIKIESTDSGGAAASLTPSEIATLRTTRTGMTSRTVSINTPYTTDIRVGPERNLRLDAPSGITISAALNSSYLKASNLELFSWIGGGSFILVNAPITMGNLGDVTIEANTFTLGSGGGITADSVEYLANTMNLYGTTSATELWTGPYGGPSSLVPTSTTVISDPCKLSPMSCNYPGLNANADRLIEYRLEQDANIFVKIPVSGDAVPVMGNAASNGLSIKAVENISPEKPQPDNNTTDDIKKAFDYINNTSTVLGLVSDSNAINAFSQKADLVIKAFDNYGSWVDKQTVANYKDLHAVMLQLKSQSPELYARLDRAMASGDVKSMHSLVDKQFLTKITKGLDAFGKFMAALTVTIEAAELAGKVFGPGDVLAQDIAKFSINSGVSGLGVTGTTMGAAVGIVYGSVSLGQLIAEIRAGEGFVDSQLRYINMANSIASDVSAHAANQIKSLARQSINSTAIKNASDFDVSFLKSKIETLDVILNDLNDPLNKAANLWSFNFSTRTKIVREVESLKLELINSMLQSESLVAQRARVASVIKDKMNKMQVSREIFGKSAVSG